ncbi:hypothetical protein D7V97_19635, partial [Corallococcus sp. CA053C]
MLMRWGWAVVMLGMFPGAGGAQDAVAPEDFEATVRKLEEAISAGASGEEESGAAQPEEEASPPATSDSTTPWTNLLRMEAATLTLLPRRGAGTDDSFV